MVFESITNLVIRSVTMVARFLLIFILAKMLTPSEFGFYGLIAATIAYALYFVGLDFYVYLTRELIKTPLKKAGGLLRRQLVLSGALYCLVFPVLGLILAHHNWPKMLVLNCLFLIFLEHFNQEIMRILVAIGRPLQASVVLFLRHGSWVFVLCSLNYFGNTIITLSLVMQYWILGGIAAGLLGIHAIFGLRFAGWRDPIDWRWMKKGIQISGLFLIASLCIRGIFTFDKYLVEHFLNIEAVGAYVLFLGVANALILFLDAGIFSLSLSPLLKLCNEKFFLEADLLIKKISAITLIGVLSYGLISYYALPFFLSWLNKDVYYDYASIYPLVFLAIGLSALSMPPHLGLYCRDKDFIILLSHALAFFAFAIITISVSYFSLYFAVPSGLVGANLVLFFGKWFGYLRLIGN